MESSRTAPLDQMRKQRIVEIVSDVLRAVVVHKSIVGFHRDGKLRFTHIEELIDDRGQSILYRLKENCHALFRHPNDGASDDGGKLIDLAIGSIFHEAMKLRENLYQVDTYRPQYLDIQKKSGPHRRILLERFERIILRAEQGVGEGISDISALFSDTVDQVMDLIRTYKDNDLLIRFLLTQRKLVVKACGRQRLDRLFHSMYRNGLFQAYWVAGMSYLNSAYFDMASQLFAKAMPLAPRDGKLKFFHKYTTGLDAYYSNQYDKALRLFDGLARLNEKFRGKRTYINHVVAVCRNISTDSLAEQNRQMARRARRVMHRIQTSRR